MTINQISEKSVLVLVLFIFLLCLAWNVPALGGLDVTYDFDRTYPESYWKNTRYSSITTDGCEVISGGKSLKLDTTSSSGQWNKVFVPSDQSVPLKGGKRYAVCFKYRIRQLLDDDSCIYVHVRSKSRAGSDKISFQFKENYRNPNFREIKFVLPEGVDDYRIIFGIRYRGSAIIDDVKIRELEDINLGAEGVEVPGDNYSPYGMCTHFERLTEWRDNAFSDQEVEDVLKMLADAGIQWIRIGGGWGSMEPKEGTRRNAQINRLDLIMDEAEANGIKVYIQMGSQPRWASEAPKKANPNIYAPAEGYWDDWGDHVTFLTTRYKGRVRYWGVGNEVDWIFWKSDLSKYARYLQIAYKAAKAVDPDNKIVMGNFAFDGVGVWQFRDGAKEYALQKLYDAGVKGYFDIFGMHPYADNSIGSIDKINTAWDILRRNGDGDKPIWITEIGMSTGGNDPAKLKEQADHIESVYSELIKHPKVEKIFWYNFRCKTHEGDRENNFGIINSDLTTRPAYKRLCDLPKSPVRKVNYSYLLQQSCSR